MSTPTDRELLIGLLNAVGIVYYRITGQSLELPLETSEGELLISCGRRFYLAEHPEAATSYAPERSQAESSTHSELLPEHHDKPLVTA